MPTTTGRLRDRTVIFVPGWMVIATDLPQAEWIKSTVGGRLFMTPAFAPEPTVTLPAVSRSSCPAGCTVQFGVNVRNPLSRTAEVQCFAKGVSSTGSLLFREPGSNANGLRHTLGPGEPVQLNGTAYLAEAGVLAKVVSWCVARPLHQPA